jgi:uncharacterized protein YqeY
MTLKETFMEEMKNAMKEKDTMKKNVVTMVRSAIKQFEVDNRVELDDEGVLEIIIKEVKKRKDSLPEYEKSGRDDLIKNLTEEINYLSKYLPAQMSEEEVRTVIKATIAEVGATSVKDMGKVMGAVINKTKGRADGKVINTIVKELLQ